MWELDHKESWTLKNWFFWTLVLNKALESPWDSKEIKPVNSRGNQAWIFIGRTDAEAEATLLWPPDAKNWLIGKDPDARQDWRQEKAMTEGAMVGWHHQCWARLKAGEEGDDRGWDGWWHHQLNRHEFEQAPGVGDGQGSLACCNPWGHKVSDMTERLNWDMNIILIFENFKNHKFFQSIKNKHWPLKISNPSHPSNFKNESKNWMSVWTGDSKLFMGKKQFTKHCNVIRIPTLSLITREVENKGMLSSQAEMACPDFTLPCLFHMLD